MMNIAVLASGRGSNFSAIIRAAKKGKIKANLSLLVCDNPKAGAAGRAKRAGVKIAMVRREDFSSRDDFERKIIEHLQQNNIDLVVLAGFMRMLGHELISRYENKIINIHPALLPSFKGAHGIKDAFDYGVKVTGVTVHFVDGQMDHGPIILQSPLRIEEGDTPESLEAKIHKLEHKIYPEAIQLFLEGRLKPLGRRVSSQVLR
ncbi:MAG: phosphoribosylglycinamide formyltransferase [Candidatus Omnitrophica bacterium]|nr:phosphoribosylglycinamide formyltransferase [Candidatus Omnitrophota bacterium]